MQRARETTDKVYVENKDLDSSDYTNDVAEGKSIKNPLSNARLKKIVMMSPRTRERRRGKYGCEDSSEEETPYGSGAGSDCSLDTERIKTRRLSSLRGLKKISKKGSTPSLSKKSKKTPPCGFCVDNDFCEPHMEYIFMDSIVDELISFTQPVFQSRIPLPNHSWREKYPIELKENASPEKIIFSSGKMDIIHPLIWFNQKTIYTCDNCLETLTDPFAFNRHKIKCNGPVPGTLIYEEKINERLTIHRVDGEVSKNYCRRLCIIGKLFLEHKTLFYDVEPFFFYVLHSNSNFVGFFSKEKTSKYNLSCIVVLPIFQGKGFGSFMIDASYCLSIGKRETGTPEKPLSKQGLASYVSYWRYTVYNEIVQMRNRASLADISHATGICVNDVVHGLELLGFIKKRGSEYFIQVESRNIREIRKCRRDCFIK